MSKEHKDPLAKVDDGKRDFLKKMAIGTAYAVPVMTTFSLDGVRNTALAQGMYAPPEVTSLEGGLNQITVNFSRPMDTSFEGSSIGAKSLPCWWSTFQTKKIEGGWRWDSNRRAVWNDSSCDWGPVGKKITVVINSDGCFGKKVLAADGLTECATYSGSAIITSDCPS
jgi:hypothetical protein